jgi:hypothetical protein
VEKNTQLKVIGGLLGLWGLVRLATSGMALTSSAQVSTLLVGVDIITGLILLAGSIGVFLKKQTGFYAGLLGVLLVLGVNIYNFVAGTGGNIVAILIVAVVGYYLYDSREALG